MPTTQHAQPALQDIRQQLQALDERIVCVFFGSCFPVRTTASACTTSPVDDDDVTTETVRRWYRQTVLSHVRGTSNGAAAPLTSADIEVIRLISQRIQMGTTVANAKMGSEADRAAFRQAPDRQGILDRLTHPQVEQEIIRRVSRDASILFEVMHQDAYFGDMVGEWFRDFIIPQTKEVQVERILELLKFEKATAASASGREE